MDREILFRGQTRKLGEKVNMAGEPVDGNWVYGGIFQGTGDYSIIYGSTDSDNITADNLEKHVVYTDTVGQYTGLTDKNEKKIFEGDICKDIMGFVFEVQWDNENARFLGRHKKLRGDVYICYVGRMPAVEVIGNIHDNPELMGGEDDG